jgi:Zn finger protein HypA/HybF involved in hydrogenase expression
MKKSKTVTFTCPGCKETFEFDQVGEYEFVPCPICGTNYMTIKKNQTLMLQAFSFTPTAPIENPTIIA